MQFQSAPTRCCFAKTSRAKKNRKLIGKISKRGPIKLILFAIRAVKVYIAFNADCKTMQPPGSFFILSYFPYFHCNGNKKTRFLAFALQHRCLFPSPSPYKSTYIHIFYLFITQGSRNIGNDFSPFDIQTSRGEGGGRKKFDDVGTKSRLDRVRDLFHPPIH